VYCVEVMKVKYPLACTVLSDLTNADQHLASNFYVELLQ
jgi:hypothetical protein